MRKVDNSLLSITVIITTIISFSFAEAAIAPYKELDSEKASIKNWGLDNPFPSHIGIRDAWRVTKGDPHIVVAVIDTGIDANHPDLKNSLWHKPGTEEYGFDFVSGTKNPIDENGHGTHIAGIIAASARNVGGVIGVAPQVKIMAIRFLSGDPHDPTPGKEMIHNSAQAINYAIDHGANIINYSDGGKQFSDEEKKAIQRAGAHGILFVAAAGNDQQNEDSNEVRHFYPAAYGLDNIISVAATNIRNQLIPCSNWGFKTVHVAAPGDNILSTLPNGRYGYLTGTSQATAFVSGLAALLLSKDRSLKVADLKRIIMKSVDTQKSLEEKIASSGRINASRALHLLSLQENRSLANLQN